MATTKPETEATEAPKTTRKTPAKKETGPKVYEALGKVLGAMAVEKGGVLPGNMGGKPYITAHDLAAEAKRQFVANNLILLPDEQIFKHDVINDNGRKTVVISVRGQYTITHIEDGSSVTVGGTGDGLATGTAVASNIASTNAFKNALLRTFMVTEQSVEEAAKNGESGGGQQGAQTASSRKIEQAKAKPAAKSGGKDYKTLIASEIINNPEDDRTGAEVNALWDKVCQEKRKPKNDPSVLPELYERLKAGEVAE